jgi:hypothetical protein
VSPFQTEITKKFTPRIIYGTITAGASDLGRRQIFRPFLASCVAWLDEMCMKKKTEPNLKI